MSDIGGQIGLTAKELKKQTGPEGVQQLRVTDGHPTLHRQVHEDYAQQQPNFLLRDFALEEDFLGLVTPYIHQVNAGWIGR